MTDWLIIQNSVIEYWGDDANNRPWRLGTQPSTAKLAGTRRQWQSWAVQSRSRQCGGRPLGRCSHQAQCLPIVQHELDGAQCRHIWRHWLQWASHPCWSEGRVLTPRRICQKNLGSIHKSAAHTDPARKQTTCAWWHHQCPSRHYVSPRTPVRALLHEIARVQNLTRHRSWKNLKRGMQNSCYTHDE